MEKKYQVFISSTYDDLKAEREKAINAILRIEHIPIGMELFNAGDDAQWAIIQRAIDNSDYYILIVGFRYGSVTEEDISYTEKEYDYAIAKKIPVIAFIKDRKSPTTKEERESKVKYQKKLDEFLSKVQKKEVSYWKNSDELAAQITSSLVNQIKLTPRMGWIRADFDPIEISQEIAVLSKENRELRKVVESISDRQPDLKITILASDKSDEEANLKFKYQSPDGNIHVHPLTVEGDLVDEIKELVTEQDLQAYNDELPTQEEITEYNDRNSLYENAQKNAHCFRLAITNNGHGKANNVYIDLQFPNELLAYYNYDIEDIEKPEKVNLPENPVQKALEAVRKSKMSRGAMALIRYGSSWGNIGATFTAPFSINTDKWTPGYYDRDHSVNHSDNTTTIKVDSLIHSRMYTSDEIWFIAVQKGTFTVGCEIMCEEYEEPVKYSFEIEIT